MKDYYKILGLTREASTDVIKQKFKELAFENHPDVSDKKNAGEIFIEIYEAYHILSDPDRKARYDMLHDKYYYNIRTHIPNEAILKNDILNTSSSLREKAQKKAKVTYRDFMKEMDCFFKKGERADGKPFSYGMHKNIGISGGTGPMGSIKSRTVRIPIPRSKKAYIIHRVGFLVKLTFFILGIAVLRFDLIPSADLYSRMLILPASIIIGSLITYSIYHSTKTKSKFFHASRFFLVKKYKKNGYRRGSHPMVSTTPVGLIIYILRVIF
jgi:hypothetical protein